MRLMPAGVSLALVLPWHALGQTYTISTVTGPERSVSVAIMAPPSVLSWASPSA